MKLSDYLDSRSNGSISSLARRAAVSRMALYKILEGGGVRRSTAERIAAATDGAVTLADLGHAASESADARPAKSATEQSPAAAL